MPRSEHVPGSHQGTAARRARFEQAALPFVDTLYTAAATMTRDPATARELVQDTYARAYIGFELFGWQDKDMRSWLYRTLADTYAYWYQRRPESRAVRAWYDLPDELRIAVYLADVEEFSETEIADITNTTVETVRTRLRRGRRRLLEDASEPTH